MLLGPEVYPLHEPGTGSLYIDTYPWQLTLDAIEELRAKRGGRTI